MSPRRNATVLPRDDRGRILREAVEYSVVDHCNLRCAGCDHAADVLSKRFADPDSFAADLAVLGRHLHVRSLRLLGGEPLLHPGLDQFVQAARKAAIADQLELWTNGLLLDEAPRQLLESFDVVRVSLYPGIRVRCDPALLARALRQGGRTRLEVRKVTRFQHQLLNHPLLDPALVRRTYRRCRDAHELSCHTVQDGRYYKCAKAPVLQPRLALRGIDVANRADDGVALHGNPNLAEQLSRYLLSPEPLTSCQWCLGTDGKSFPHHQRCGANSDEGLPAGALDARALLAGPVRRWVRDLRACLGLH